MHYQSDTPHWNLSQIDTVGKLGQKALMSEHLYFAPPQLELFCISVSWMCNQSLTPPFAPLRLRVKSRTQRRKGAKAQRRDRTKTQFVPVPGINEPHGKRLDILKKEAKTNGFGLVIA